MKALLLAATLLLAGCAGMQPEDFAAAKPTFVIEDYFAGKTKAWGIFQDRFGNLKRSFTVDIDGRWDGRELTLTENFLYNDGETEQRVWHITKPDEHTYHGTAGDVIGTAVGKAYGNALNWRYDLNLKVGDGTLEVAFDDWMFLQDKEVMLNKATVSKFGIELGVVTLAFRKF